MKKRKKKDSDRRLRKLLRKISTSLCPHPNAPRPLSLSLSTFPALLLIALCFGRLYVRRRDREGPPQTLQLASLLPASKHSGRGMTNSDYVGVGSVPVSDPVEIPQRDEVSLGFEENSKSLESPGVRILVLDWRGQEGEVRGAHRAIPGTGRLGPVGWIWPAGTRMIQRPPSRLRSRC